MSPDVKLLAVGDSYVVGEGVPIAKSWPHQLAATLVVDRPDIVAMTGWTSEELLMELRSCELGKYDWAFAQVGVNDQYRGLSTTSFSQNAAALLGLLASHSNQIVGVSIPDWSVTPHGHDFDREAVSSEIDRFNDAWRSCCEEAGASWVDVTDLSRRYATELTSDGLHPSGMHYSRWAAAVHSHIQIPQSGD